jgi:hypothetical protein
MLHVLLGDIVVKSTTDQSLGGEESVLGVLHGLTLSNITDVTGAIFSKRDNGRSSSLT